MDPHLVYAKTPIGDEAVRQSTRVVQRNLRMVLVQVDGKLTVEELGIKIGNPKLVESALRDLESEGYIAPTLEAASIWEQSKKAVSDLSMAASSRFSTPGPKSILPPDIQGISSRPSAFTSFGKPILPSRADSPSSFRGASKERFEEPVVTEKEDQEERPNRPRNTSRLVIWGLLGSLLVVVLIALFFPYNQFKPKIEASMTKALRTPVHINNVEMGLLPRPMLSLQGVKLGEHGESSIAEIAIPSTMSMLGSGRAVLSRAVLRDVRMSVDQLGSLAGISDGLGRSDTGFALLRAEIESLSAKLGELTISGLTGEVFFSAEGKLQKLSMQTEDRALRIDATPTAQGTALHIEGFGWKAFGESAFVFESLLAKGLLQPGKLVIQDIDTTFMGGLLKGSWLLDWSNGFTMAGDATLARLNARKVSEAVAAGLKIDGELGGGPRGRGAGATWQALWKNREGSLDADIARGMLNGLDLGEATRRGAGYVVRSGFTKFDRMTGQVNFGGGQVKVNDILLEAGLLKAIGQATATPAGKVEGSFDVSLQSAGLSLRTPVRISGVLPELQAVSGR